MKKNDLIHLGDTYYRVLSVENDYVLIIDCKKGTMPSCVDRVECEKADLEDDDVLPPIPKMEDLTPKERQIALSRYAIIADILCSVADRKKRKHRIAQAAEHYGLSKQTIRGYLCRYLVYQDIAALAPQKKQPSKGLTTDQKNIRWALNRYYYSRNQNSIPAAYSMMLKERYCDSEGKLLPDHPSIHQFRYFYEKTRKLEHFYISRNGINHYKRNNRPLLGDGVQEFAPTIGTAMLDSTICDIYLIDEAGQIVGRPILVVAVDANTSLCLGYSLLWEGGTYSLRELMQNIIEDKVLLCKRMGIDIKPEQWNVKKLPLRMITDGGTEYVGKNFEQITELGVRLESLPPYRPELKGTVERFFELLQSSYKNSLKGKGVIMPDFQERGAHDYRKDACLTLSEFEKIVVRCIVYYNSGRVIDNYPYTPEMLDVKVKPYASELWNWKLKEEENNLISVSKRELSLTLLPRTVGTFSRYGLRVNHLRYYAEGFKEQFLQGGKCMVAYNPDDCNRVWVRDSEGRYTEFSLIESRFKDKSLEAVTEMQATQKQLVRDVAEENLRAKVELLDFIETVSRENQAQNLGKTTGIRSARSSAKRKNHKDIGGKLDEN